MLENVKFQEDSHVHDWFSKFVSKKINVYLTMLSTRFVYGYMASVKDHTARERKPATVTTWDTLYDYQQGMFYMLRSTVVEHLNKK